MKGHGCRQKSANLSVYEAQLLSYLETFHIPEDYQQRILQAQKELEKAYSDTEAKKRRLESQLNWAKELYVLGDYSKAEYEAQRDKILDQLRSLIVPRQPAKHLEKMAQFLADVPAAWIAAPPEQPVESTPTVEEGGLNWYIIVTILAVVLLLAIFLPVWIRRRRYG